VKKTVLRYGLGGALIVVLKLTEYRFLVVEHSLEIYGGLVALIFASLGIWLGLKLTRPKERLVIREVPIAAGGPFVVNAASVERFGVTPRELEILQLIAEGLSTREIAVYFGVRSYRDNVAGGSVRFGRAFAVGALIALISSSMYVVTWEVIYFRFMPDFVEKYSAHQIAAARASFTGGDRQASRANEAAGQDVLESGVERRDHARRAATARVARGFDFRRGAESATSR
jgi:hypothetical protein